MAKALEGIDWEEIRKGYESGATSQQLAALHGVAASLIRTRACRKGWLNVKPSTNNRALVAKAAKVAVNKAVAKVAKSLEQRAAYSVEQCVNESIDLGRDFMRQAKERLSQVEDGNLSAVATLGRAGVEIARKSLGLDATGAASINCAIQFNFVARGVDAFGATADATPGVTSEAVDV